MLVWKDDWPLTLSCFYLDEDVKLNSTVFHWPEHILKIFELSKNRIDHRKDIAIDELKLKYVFISLFVHTANVWLSVMRSIRHSFGKKRYSIDYDERTSWGSLYHFMIHVWLIIDQWLIIDWSILDSWLSIFDFLYFTFNF